jgi:hypothetical protein
LIAASKRPQESGRETGDGFFTLEPRGAIGFFPSTVLAVEAVVETYDRPPPVVFYVEGTSGLDAIGTTVASAKTTSSTTTIVRLDYFTALTSAILPSVPRLLNRTIARPCFRLSGAAHNPLH